MFAIDLLVMMAGQSVRGRIRHFRITWEFGGNTSVLGESLVTSAGDVAPVSSSLVRLVSHYAFSPLHAAKRHSVTGCRECGSSACVFAACGAAHGDTTHGPVRGVTLV